MRVIDRLFQFLVFLTVIWFVSLGAWWLGTQLSSDAIGLALGVIFGILAALPGGLLALTAGRRSAPAQPAAQQQWPPAPPVIVIAGNAPAALPGGERALLPDHWSQSQPQAQQWRDVRPEGRRSNTETAYFDREAHEILAPEQWRERQAQQVPGVIDAQPQRTSPPAQSDAEGGWYDA